MKQPELQHLELWVRWDCGGLDGNLVLRIYIFYVVLFQIVIQKDFDGINNQQEEIISGAAFKNLNSGYQFFFSFRFWLIFSERLDKWEKLAVADALEETSYPDGELIIKQGQVGEEFFFVVEGWVSKDKFSQKMNFVIGLLLSRRSRLRERKAKMCVF